jgi:orsellinic acid C2-O-methyltransferase
MTETAEAHRGALLTMMFGFYPAQVLHTAARLGIAETLTDGPTDVRALAARLDAHEPSLHRLLRALVLFGVLDETDGRYALTDRGQLLRGDMPGSIRNLTMLFCCDEVWRSWGQLEYSVRTGMPSWDHVLGLDNFEYLESHPALNAVFNRAMGEGSRVAAPGVVGAYDFSDASVVVDVGGGNGTLIAAILQAHPHLRGVLFDLPSGAETAESVLAAGGVVDRCDVVVGDFFDSVVEGGDIYVIKSVIHDWDDARSVTILEHCRTAMPDDGTLLVVEPIMPASVAGSQEAWGMVMSDLNMLAVAAGKERTQQEFTELLGSAGFRLQAVTPCGPPTGFSVMAARPL